MWPPRSVPSPLLLRSLFLSTLILSLVLSFGAEARAQSADPEAPVQAPAQAPEPTREARRLHGLGLDAASHHRWEEALRYFEEARDLVERPSIVFNIARAQHTLGRHSAARDTLRAFFRDFPSQRLREEFPDFEAETLEQARALLLETSAHLATLSLLGLEEGATHQIELDGVAVEDDGARPVEIETDEGAHGLNVSLPGFRLFHWSGNLRGGRRYPLRIALEPEEHATPLWQEPWVWILTVAVLALGATLGGVLGWLESQPEPQACEVTPCFEVP